MLSPQHILALGVVPGMTLETLRNLIERNISFEELLSASDEELVRWKVKATSVRSLRDPAPYLKEAERQIRRAEEFGATIIQYPDKTYPAALREIWAAPITLYVWGELHKEDERGIGVVGTRGASVYGRITTEKYAKAFVGAGVTVVSGLARGVDTYAHTAAIQSGGRTFAVIASGLDRIQPSISAGLAKQISQQGAVITEYPFGVKAMPAYFPQRNRIISGLCKGTVVVESGEKGGALITARFALDQNREVFAVPGPISSPKSAGTNNLIRTDRARLTQTPEDVLDALGYHIPLPDNAKAASTTQNLSLFEQQVYDLLSGEPTYADDLCERSGLSPSDLLVTLLNLEFKGLARQMAGKMFLRG